MSLILNEQERWLETYTIRIYIWRATTDSGLEYVRSNYARKIFNQLIWLKIAYLTLILL